MHQNLGQFLYMAWYTFSFATFGRLIVNFKLTINDRFLYNQFTGLTNIHKEWFNFVKTTVAKCS